MFHVVTALTFRGIISINGTQIYMNDNNEWTDKCLKSANAKTKMKGFAGVEVQ